MSPARYLVICTPAGFDRFVDACADAQPGPVEAGLPTEADTTRMRAAATQFGITLIPPPLSTASATAAAITQRQSHG
ncbi:hypothetical protein PPGU19_085440 (plasmid) [Paraburkholderia sp. PGU19]|uniref:hypothetical protein n=1 Tax=Paraburkholderia sp. PGU19 TaxID=2735434 RepID=UPI0015DA8328|nr:hypothetical protein [Paraburkholderia sp. PGU19]BCG03976.1 hypothetical protein PPGU19_085440 [Paraburkholderia sp. PGU19]